MDLVERKQLQKTLKQFKIKINTISSITDEEKELFILISEILDTSINLLDDICETIQL